MVLLSNDVTDVWYSGDVPALVITLILCIGGCCFIHVLKRKQIITSRKGLYSYPPFAPGGLWFTLKMRLGQKNAYWVMVRLFN